MFAVTPYLREFVSDDCTLQRSHAHTEDPLIEHANRGDALMQRMRREVAAVKLDLGQLRHGWKCTMRRWLAFLTPTSTNSIAPSAPCSMRTRSSGARRCSIT